MFPELFDYSQAEDIGYLCVHRKTGGQDVSILNTVKEIRQESGFTFTKDSLCCHFQILMSFKPLHIFYHVQLCFFITDNMLKQIHSSLIYVPTRNSILHFFPALEKSKQTKLCTSLCTLVRPLISATIIPTIFPLNVAAREKNFLLEVMS